MKNSLIVISPYPTNGRYSHQSSALASFNKNLIDSMKKNDKNLKIIILADNENKKDHAAKTWVKNDFFNYFKLIKTIVSYKNTKDILIQFEWGVFGKNIFFVCFFPVFLLVLKLLGKKSRVVLHGVNFDFKSIFGSGLKTKLLKAGGYIFYSLTCLLAEKIVVTENYFRKELSKLPFTKDKVIFIPHGVDTFFIKKQNKNKGKINLGYFGFLHPYKGPKILLDLYEAIDKTKFSLSFFGGESPNLMKNKDYQSYMKNFYLKAKKLGVKITGFVEQSKLNKYFNEVDLVVFPYPIFISSSGMLAMAFSFEKPFILSQPMIGYFDSPDFTEVLKEACLKKEDFIFDFNQESFEYKLNWTKKNLDKLVYFSRIMKEKRGWEKVVKRYEKLLE